MKGMCKNVLSDNIMQDAVKLITLYCITCCFIEVIYNVTQLCHSIDMNYYDISMGLFIRVIFCMLVIFIDNGKYLIKYYMIYIII